MLKETLEYLNIHEGEWFVDCNLGGGGHTEGILKAGGNVLGVDLDPDAIKEVSKNLKEYIDKHRLILKQTNFVNIDSAVAEAVLTMKQFNNETIAISGVLFDLGVSTHQLEETERGFSFNKDAPLDMRMDPSKGASAKDLVNGLYEKELAELFLKLGEENWSKPIAKKIVQYRERKQIETTNELASIILSVRRRSPSDRTHPATRIFQALRIAVNDELNSLKGALPNAFEVLKPGGRIVVISFHSLEDRIVKQYFNSLCHPELVSESSTEFKNTEAWKMPKQVRHDKPLAKLITDKPFETTEEEANWNPRSRSAKLRVIEKL